MATQKPSIRRPVKRTYGNPVTRIINDWWDRLLGAVNERSLADQDEAYDAGMTSRDFVWNTVGFATWGMMFPILTIVVTQLVGVERAGMFSLAFVTANLLYILGNYGVRTYQVSDINEYHSFSDYQVNRIITCAIMVIVGVLYCCIRGYAGEMFFMSIGVYVYKAIDALGDVYEGRLQQADKLYLGGVSIAIRSMAAFIVFTIVLLVTGNLAFASFGMAIGAAASFVFVTLPLTLFETKKSQAPNFKSIRQLFMSCFPVFVALFLYALIDNLPKFLMEGFLTYDNQLYFNALYFPAQAVLLTVGFIYKPMLVRMSNLWADPAKRGQFDRFIVIMVIVIAGITVVGIVAMAFIGIPIMSMLYGLDFEQFRVLSYIMLAAGGMTACIDFLYQVITILRRQKVVTGLYMITFGIALLVLILLISTAGLLGAVVGYLIVMSVLFVLLIREYISVRRGFAKNSGRRR